MKKYSKSFGMVIGVVLMTLLHGVLCLADENITLSADKTSCEVGEAISVNVSVTPEEGSATPPQINIEYNANRLTFDNCSVEYGGGGGGLITISDTAAVIDFTTLSGGDAVISVSAVLGDGGTTQSSELTISVAGEDTAAGTDEVVSDDFGIEASQIMAADGRVVQSVFASEFMPTLFHKATTVYQGQNVESAQFDMADMTLLYTTDSQGNDGKFCKYNVATGELSDFRMIQGIENRFIIVLDECEGDIPSGYTKAVLDWNGQTLTAYTNTEASNGNASLFGNLPANDFFLVYGLSSEGAKGWYQYDLSEGTYQRFVQYTNMAVADSQPGDQAVNPSAGGSEETFLDGFLSRQVQMILLLVFLALTLILIIVVIILAIKCAEYSDYEYADDDYYGYQNVEAARSNAANAAAAVRKSMYDGIESIEDEDDEDEEEEEQDETLQVDEAKANNNNGKASRQEEPDDSDESDEASDEEASDDEEDAKNEEQDNDEESDDDEESETDVSRGGRLPYKKKYYTRPDVADEDEDEEDEDEDIDGYFDPRMSRREAKAIMKQQKREEKEAAKEEKWRRKEEKRAAKMRDRGYEETSPMDWSSFSEEMGDSVDSRRPVGKSKLPSYMQGESSEEVENNASSDNSLNDNENASNSDTIRGTRRSSNIVSKEREEESARQKKEDEQRMKQKRLFEQQQRIEEQRRIEQEQYEEEQRLAQERYVLSQRGNDELDEDFEFEFLDI